jgi:hypothetical protein
MYLGTTRELYDAFLDGIKKPYTGTVIPSVFNRLMNEWAQAEWVASNLSDEQGSELTQKQMDDLEVLRVVTDGELSSWDATTIFLPIKPVSGTNSFVYPKYNQLLLATDNAYHIYPKYRRFLNVRFKIEYVDNDCGLTGISEWLNADIMRSDQRVVFEDSEYRKPMDDNLYYEMINGVIRLITGTPSKAHSMRLEYYREPRAIFFDELHPVDVPNPNYTPGVGSVNCELDYVQKMEIVKIATRLYLERVQDPRYKSFFQEQMISSNSNK